MEHWKLIKMKKQTPALFWVFVVITSCLTVNLFGEEVYAARALVQSVEEIQSSQAIVETNPVMRAAVQIQDVLSGPPSLKGKSFMVYSSAVFPTAGNAYVVTPNLKVGDEGIFVFKLLRDGSPCVQNYRQAIGEDALPLIRGRDPSYEAALKRIIHRRDHPEAYKAAEVKAAPPPQVPPQPPTVIPKPKPPAPPTVPVVAKPENDGHFNLVLWIAAGVVILITVIFVFRRKGSGNTKGSGVDS